MGTEGISTILLLSSAALEETLLLQSYKERCVVRVAGYIPYLQIYLRPVPDDFLLDRSETEEW